MEVVFLANWYNEKDEKRRAELLRCIEKTVDSMEVDRVICLHEGDDLCPVPGVENVQWTHRPTYRDFFQFINEEVSSKEGMINKGDVVIVANTDIYPDYGTGDLIEKIKSNQAYALSRWDEQADGSKVHLDRWDTADAWVFKAPINIPADCDFRLGQAGCDNAIAARLSDSGYSVLNPSKTIKFIHYHLSGVLNYTDKDRIKKPYLLITPHELGQPASYHEDRA